MNIFCYFKVPFLSIIAGLFAGLLVYGVFDFSNSEYLTKLLLKSFVAAVVAGLILEMLNMFLKIGNFQKKKSS
ncbi:MAG: hypothetical protein RIQ59_404 [Bacteroidota bacterium]|jgi:hypothetical protein